MDQLQLPLRVVLGLLGEGAAPVLGEDAGVTELVHVLHEREATDHAGHLADGVEVDVAKTFMSPPGILLVLGEQGHQARHLES